MKHRPPHEILGTAPRPTLGELDAARRAKLFELHPDRHPEDRAGAGDRTREVEEAYQVLRREITGEPPADASVLGRIFSAAADAGVTVMGAAADALIDEAKHQLSNVGDQLEHFIRGLFR